MDDFANSLRGALLSLLITISIAQSPTPASASAATPPGLWVENGQLTKQAQQLLGVLRQPESYGLSAADFAELLTRIEAGRLAGEAGALDELVTSAASRLIRQLHGGRVDPRAAG